MEASQQAKDWGDLLVSSSPHVASDVVDEFKTVDLAITATAKVLEQDPHIGIRDVHSEPGATLPEVIVVQLGQKT